MDSAGLRDKTLVQGMGAVKWLVLHWARFVSACKGGASRPFTPPCWHACPSHVLGTTPLPTPIVQYARVNRMREKMEAEQAKVGSGAGGAGAAAAAGQQQTGGSGAAAMELDTRAAVPAPG